MKLTQDEINTLHWAFAYPLWSEIPMVLGVAIEEHENATWRAIIVSDDSAIDENPHDLMLEAAEASVLVYNSNLTLSEKEVPAQYVTAKNLAGLSKDLNWVYQSETKREAA